MIIKNEKYKQSGKLFFFYIIIFSLLTYPIFYSNYKFSTPSLGNLDYFRYEKMVDEPFNSNTTKSPFVFRQFTTTIAHLIYKTNISYKTKTVFGNVSKSQKIYFSLLLTNYIGILLCLSLLTTYLQKKYKFDNTIMALFPGILIYSGFNFHLNGIAPLTEGFTYFFTLVLFLCLKENKIILFSLTTLLCLVQKESILIFLAFYISSSIILNFAYFKNLYTKNDLTYLAVIAIGLLGYITMTKLLSSIIIDVDQIKYKKWFDNFKNFNFSIEYFLQSIFSNIILFGLLITSIFFQIRKNSIIKPEILYYTGSIIGLFILGIILGINTNIGRIIASSAPVGLVVMMPELSTLFYTKRLN